MKIGILTQPLRTNYGGLLQNFALQYVLKLLGNDVITLDQVPTKIPPWILVASCVKTFFLKVLGKGSNRKYPCQLSRQRKLIESNTRRFIDSYIIYTSPLSNDASFRRYIAQNHIDVLLVGSDQVWRPIYNRNVLWNFFSFADNLDIKRIAYAASFGVDFWEFSEKQTYEAKKLIKLFDAISVRERSGIDLCKRFLNCDATHVLDPTMLLEKDDYARLVESENVCLSKGELFTYILDETPQKQEFINSISAALSLTPFACMPQTSKDAYPPVTQWIRAFMDAKFVVCDSFHGAVFSIIFNIPFLIIGNKERGMSRFDSLLDTFGLQSRLVDDMTSIKSVMNTPIDWPVVNSIREEMKTASIEYLISVLKIS